MAVNSIWDNMDKDSIINEIRSMISYPGNQSTFVVVEGPDDSAFFNDKLSAKTELVESFSGKKGVKEIVEYFHKKQVIGVCDRDYQQPENEERIFYYDYCCLEMMLVANDDVMRQLGGEFYRGSLSAQQLREKILHELKWISVFRKLNSEKGWNVRFGSNSQFPVPNILDESKSFQLSEAKKIINQRNASFIDTHSAEYAQVQEAWQNDPDDLVSLLHITQGHDFVSCFKCFCTDDTKKAPASDSVEHSLRCAYRMTDFQQTALYAELKAYEGKTSLSILSA